MLYSARLGKSNRAGRVLRPALIVRQSRRHDLTRTGRDDAVAEAWG